MIAWVRGLSIVGYHPLTVHSTDSKVEIIKEKARHPPPRACVNADLSDPLA